jgi:hypothetical protein
MKILYVNGDSHSAGAEIAGPWAFAEDDSKYGGLGRMPHPANLELSYGKLLADKMGYNLECDAESASSNQRIIRTTFKTLIGVQGLPVTQPDFVVIGWSTWERKEFHDTNTGRIWQVNAGGVGEDWPQWLKDQYPKYVSEINWDDAQRRAHEDIHQLHLMLNVRKIPHVFFNTYSHFDPQVVYTNKEWDGCYLNPYSKEGTYYAWCLTKGFKPVSKNSYHFGADAHAAWAEYLYSQIVNMMLTAL